MRCEARINEAVPNLRDLRFAAPPVEAEFGSRFGLLPRQKIALMMQRGMIAAAKEIEPSQQQPASLDLRLGEAFGQSGRLARR